MSAYVSEKTIAAFDEPVAETMEEAEAFLEDCMAVVVDSLDEVREYFEESGADVENMDAEELEEHLKYSRFQVDAI